MARHRKFPDLRRKVGNRLPKKKFVLYCEGQNTEPEYFKALKKLCDNALIDIEPVGGAGAPATIADAAIKDAQHRGLAKKSRAKLNSFEQGDEVWAVFDRDQHPNFIESIQRCEAHGVHVARSTPCFELWIILHLDDFDSPVGRHIVQDALKNINSDYDPNGRKLLNFSEIISKVEVAEKRAQEQLARRIQEGDAQNSPSTTVHYLTLRIRKAGKLGNPKIIPVVP